jgi:hypothetical protein
LVILVLSSYSDLQTLSDSPLSKRLIEKISSIESKRDQTKLRESPSVDDLQDKAIFSGISVDPQINASGDLLLQSGSRKSEDPDGSKKGHSKPESRSSSAVKKMISAFESTSPQVLPFVFPFKCKQNKPLC